MKNILAIVILLLSALAVNAQTTGTQTVTMNLVNTIEMKFTATGTTTGSSVNMAFNSVNDYANGVISAAQALNVLSNKNFNVTVKTNNANFSYSGTTTPTPQMPVSGKLLLQVSSNSTGGSIVSPFSSTAYSTLTSTNQNLISNGTRGGSQAFSVKYQATPGFSYGAGTYTVDVVYTATQL